MQYKFIQYQLNGKVLKITLNRPEVLNSLNTEMRMELISAFQSAEEDNNVRAVLLTGEGRAFSAGQDLKEVALEDGSAISPRGIVRETYNPLIKIIREIKKPVVCAVNGIAAGASANIAFACDIVLASSEASFIQSFSRIGLIPDSGGTYFLPRLIGMQRASALMMTADPVSAQQALEMGLIYKVFPQEQLKGEAENLAARLSEMPTRALGLIKQALNKSYGNDLDSQLELEAELQELAGQTKDYQTGIKAFLEKRKPEFKGK